MFNHSIGTWIHRRRVKSADHPALIDRGASLTYSELATRVDQASHALSTLGITKGERVAYIGENSHEFLEAMFGATQIGGIFVPLNTRLAPPEIAFQIEDTTPRVFICAEDLLPTVLSALEGLTVDHLVIVGDKPTTPLALDGTATHQWEELITAAPREHPQERVELSDPALILFTSGTTGNPKGAVLTHENMVWNSFNVITDYDYTSESVALMISPMFHVAALGMGVLPVLLKGGTVILEQKFRPERALRLIEQYGVTSMSGVLTTYQMLCEHENWESTDISTLKQLTCGGSAVPDRVLDAYESRGLRFTMGYGMTETSPGVTSLPGTYSRSKQGSSGLPHFHTAIKVVDAQGNELPLGQEGEILVSGPNVIEHYWNRDEANRASFNYTDGAVWLHTGDVGYLDADGFLHVSDRIKDMIISGGENIYPAQVEKEIAHLEGVASSAVFGVPDARWGEVPCAVIQLRPGFHLTEYDVVNFLAGKLAKYKIPKFVFFVADLPRTASGKVKKTDLKKNFGDQSQIAS
ncbi:long-chain fatty acid--CoA ligase [Corynebacterium uropygiale]|uniref:Long-chain fatty acid--CoA ligase n=1 Tax=Corynebacterium uropygiale TaxID=1775911 RepID=A0A9X1TZZ8_9CORY|nr:long-chain fatty acid--CoA ligase [Corynebacterium uropygiale]MCF4007476.1 long-chain fatty acid--CoA ligase [Corynebacterium uropygiale]